MPNHVSWPARAAARMAALAVFLAAGCTVPQTPLLHPPATAVETTLSSVPVDAQLARLASDMAPDAVGAELVAAPPAAACGSTTAPVVRFVIPEPVLFATASDQPAPDAAAMLDDIAHLVARDVPGTEVTVLGHTDAVGSDAYNMDLSRRRAETVLQILAAHGLDRARLSAVAIGKRQPVADNATPEGRARNRRVEFLVSPCMAANLGVVAAGARPRALLPPDNDANQAVAVFRLDLGRAYGLAPVTSISLKAPEGDPGRPGAIQASAPAAPASVRPPALLARPAPAPHYQPRTLAPDVQRNPLGPAVPF